jgi:hypothetical protein
MTEQADGRWSEQEWLTCEDPDTMLRGGLEILAGQTGMHLSERKCVLFMVASLRPIVDVFTDPRSRQLVYALERYADGLLPRPEMDALGAATVNPRNPDDLSDVPNEACSEERLRLAYAWDALVAAVPPFQGYEFSEDAWNVALSAAFATTEPESQRRAQAQLLRDIFGNPFRPVAVDPARLTPRVVELTRTIYDDRAFDRLPVLADALEEASCHNADILAHCRQPGEHLLGCWVVDLLLGKE